MPLAGTAERTAAAAARLRTPGANVFVRTRLFPNLARLLAGLAKGDESVLKDRKDIDAQNRIYIPHRVIVKNPGNVTIGDSPTLDVEVFFPEMKKLQGVK